MTYLNFILMAHGNLSRKGFAMKIFKQDSVAGDRFLSYWNHKLIKFEESLFIMRTRLLILGVWVNLFL